MCYGLGCKHEASAGHCTLRVQDIARLCPELNDVDPDSLSKEDDISEEDWDQYEYPDDYDPY